MMIPTLPYNGNQLGKIITAILPARLRRIFLKARLNFKTFDFGDAVKGRTMGLYLDHRGDRKGLVFPCPI
jgi:hypothetical protein